MVIRKTLKMLPPCIIKTCSLSRELYVIWNNHILEEKINNYRKITENNEKETVVILFFSQKFVVENIVEVIS